MSHKYYHQAFDIAAAVADAVSAFMEFVGAKVKDADMANIATKRVSESAGQPTATKGPQTVKIGDGNVKTLSRHK